MKPKFSWQFLHGRPAKLRTYWRKLMRSTEERMSRGGRNIFKIISWARRDNWRRKQKVEKPKAKK
ncbi:MAG TPA: hypothetical protein ENI08_01100 [Candidatus Dependentiae bacterium]|nr:hypothetical protein [Candidatus Dependentiae bacterium]